MYINNYIYIYIYIYTHIHIYVYILRWSLQVPYLSTEGPSEYPREPTFVFPKVPMPGKEPDSIFRLLFNDDDTTESENSHSDK